MHQKTRRSLITIKLWTGRRLPIPITGPTEGAPGPRTESWRYHEIHYAVLPADSASWPSLERLGLLSRTFAKCITEGKMAALLRVQFCTRYTVNSNAKEYPEGRSGSSCLFWLQKTGASEEVEFKTKPQIALEQLCWAC
jgi:hypothetical protein